MIAQRAGRRPEAAWFERGADGSGVDVGQRRFPVTHFPRLMLTRRWPEARQRRLAREFIDWWAPALLQLQHLSDTERAELETAAVRRATVLARLFRLYPKLIDERLIRVARVQARMQASDAAVAHYEEPFVWSE